MKVKYIVHRNITEKELSQIIEIKKIAWPYSFESHLQWIESNIKNDDIHMLLLNENDAVTAYLSMTAIVFEINGTTNFGFGIGNVCSATKGSGHGAYLMEELKKYFDENKKIGLLFCKEKLISFYEKYSWILISFDKITNATIDKQIYTMILNFNGIIKHLTYTGKIF